MLDFTFWLNFQMGGVDPFLYHVVNVTAALPTAVVVTLIGRCGCSNGPASKRRESSGPALGAFAGALFLVHPLQTESVAYVASRSGRS